MSAVKREKGMYSWSRCQWSASVIRIDESVIFFLDIYKNIMYVCMHTSYCIKIFGFEGVNI